MHGIILAHFGTRSRMDSLQASHDEVNLLLRLMGLSGQVRVEPGASHALPDARMPVDSPGARFIGNSGPRRSLMPSATHFPRETID